MRLSRISFVLMLILWIFCMSRECQCYTRQYRQLIVPDDLITDGEEQKMIDPTHFLFINSGYRNNSDRLCSILSCRVTSDRMYSTLVHWLRITYRNYASRIDGLATKEWLAVADARSQKLFIDTLFEVRYVLQGEVVPSGDCNNRTNVKRSECLFAKVCYEQGISTQVLSNTLLSSEDEDSILSAALTLFNLMKYDQSEALAFYTLNRLLRAGPISDVVDNHVVHAHINVNIDLTLRVCTIISEILRLRGQIADATTSTLFTITYRDDIGSESGVRIDHGSILYRLRLLLTVPSIPARKDVAEKNRQEMIEDIDKFGTMVRMHRTELSMSIKELVSEISATVFYLAHQGLNDLDIQSSMYNLFTAVCPSLLHNSRGLIASRTLETPDIVNGDKILKIGFVSPNFFDHSIGRMLVETIIMMDQLYISRDNTNFFVTVYVYFIDRTIAHDVRIENLSSDRWDHWEDPVTINFRKHLQHRFRRVPHNVTTIREVIENDGLDFLLFSDIGMDFTNYLLSFSRIATFQAAWWGHPVTTGVESIDYFFGLDDEIFEAGHEQYSEQLVRMDTINTEPVLPLNKTELIAEVGGYKNFWHLVNMPTDARFALVLGRLFKIHPEFIDTIAQLLVMLNNSNNNGIYYIVFVAEKIIDWNDAIYRQLKEAYKNINERQLLFHKTANAQPLKVRFIHLSLYRQLVVSATVVLDTFPYGGCLTTHDALSNGIPIVTLPSNYIRGRFTMSMYRQMNYSELVAYSTSEFIEKAHRLLTDSEYQRDQSEIIKNKFPLIRQNSLVAEEWLRFIARLF